MFIRIKRHIITKIYKIIHVVTLHANNFLLHFQFFLILHSICIFIDLSFSRLN